MLLCTNTLALVTPPSTPSLTTYKQYRDPSSRCCLCCCQVDVFRHLSLQQHYTHICQQLWWNGVTLHVCARSAVAAAVAEEEEERRQQAAKDVWAGTTGATPTPRYCASPVHPLEPKKGQCCCVSNLPCVFRAHTHTCIPLNTVQIQTHTYSHSSSSPAPRLCLLPPPQRLRRPHQAPASPNPSRFPAEGMTHSQTHQRLQQQAPGAAGLHSCRCQSG